MPEYSFLRNMATMQKLCKNVWKLSLMSNLYLLKLKEWVVIDTGPAEDKELVKRELSSIVPLEKVSAVILTHLHFDHIGNADLFQNAELFASAEEIRLLRQNKLHAILNDEAAKKFSAMLHPLKDMLGLKIILTPGHTLGSVCLWYPREKVLFSGDTLFENGYGRVDFPFSDAEAMEKSLALVRKIPYKILAAGHDY
ncbi:MBL fold metallo-hydrolase [Candidatus Woesearchaeota archaeon]|nr:MBL fold metallo-hydrolase [Candidatus Woesearchaeota archaeon]